MNVLRTIILTGIVVSALGITALSGALVYVMHYHTVDLSALAHYNPGSPTIILDDQGQEWTRFSYDRREPVQLEQVPQHVIDAFVAAEDWQFFSHAGISWRGIIRSSLVNFMHGRIVQGASTITQQLVKLLFFDSRRTFSRKIKEQVYAVLIEQQFTKEYILQTYLNHVYFGCGMYGIRAAAQRLWGKDIAVLTIDESAMLAAIVRSPGSYNPMLNMRSAKRRRDIVLSSMKKLGFISGEEYRKAVDTPIMLHVSHDEFCAAHWKESLRVMLEEQFGKDALYSGGLVVQTTMSRTAQQAAQESLKKHITSLRTTLHKPVDGAILSIDVKTGAIKALVGGYDFSVSKFNRALQARRQIGSIFKPLIYACAVQQGHAFDEIERDEPLDIMQHGALWQPHNYDNEFAGDMTLARALVRSNNIIAIKTLLKTGYQPVIDLARRCHISAPIPPYPSIALGCIDTTMKEVAGMFTIFASAGIYHDPHMILWVKDRWGTKIWKAQVTHERVLEPVVVGQVAKVLEYGIIRMRAVFGEILVDSDVICKTGTTNDSRTCWFAGATPELCTVVYVGCDDNQSMGENIYPLRTAFPIWRDIYARIPTAQKKFVYDPLLHERSIHGVSGRLYHAQDAKDMNAIRIMVRR